MKKLLSMMIKLLALTLAMATVACTKPATDVDAPYASLSKVTFEESDEQFPNPERGFLTHLEFFASKEQNTIASSLMESNYLQNRTLLFTIYYLDSFMSSPISEEYLTYIAGNMKALREGGAKCVLRFAYNRSYSEFDHPWDATEEVVHQHIAQLTPIFQEYSDVIFCLEAGFVGTFGEWYYTDNFGFEPRTVADFASRRRLVDALLKAMPADRMVLVRYPAAKLGMFDITIADSLTVATAHDGSAISRLGAHNDCFVSSSNDVGTYKNNNERLYVYSESRYTIMGGETCAKTAYCKCDLAMPKIELHHLTYLNNNYHQGALGVWREQNCYDEIAKRMGYRLVIDRAFVTKAPKAGEACRVVIKIRNVGFAAPMNPRDVELVVVSKSGEKSVFKVDADPRYWFEDGEYTVDTSIDLPASMAAGDYELYLNLPDPKPTLRNNPMFSIRTANTGCWNEILGANKIATLKIN